MATRKAAHIPVHFAADTDQLEVLLATHPRDLLVLCGQLSLASLEPRTGLEDYIAEEPRALERTLPWKGKPSRQLHVWTHKDSAARMHLANARVVYAADALLRYAQRLKRNDDVLVVAAFSATFSSVVTAMRVRKGRIESINDYMLGSSHSHTYEADLHVLMERLQLEQPSAVIHWAGPQPHPHSLSCVAAPAALWQAAPATRLGTSPVQKALKRHGLSALLVAGALAGYAGSLWLPYQRYEAAAQSIAREGAGVQHASGFATERLRLLEARKAYLEAARRNTERLHRFESVLSAIAQQPEAKLLEARLLWAPEQDITQRAYDFELKLEVPARAETTALEQSLPLLRELSTKLGMSLRLAPGEAMRAGSGENAKRVYKVFGEFSRV